MKRIIATTVPTIAIIFSAAIPASAQSIQCVELNRQIFSWRQQDEQARVISQGRIDKIARQYNLLKEFRSNERDLANLTDPKVRQAIMKQQQVIQKQLPFFVPSSDLEIDRQLRKMISQVDREESHFLKQRQQFQFEQQQIEQMRQKENCF